MTYKEKLLKIFEKHGASEQLKKLSEEVFELQEALINYILGVCEKECVEFEFADVMVLLNQIMYTFKLNPKNIQEIQISKIDRQCKRDDIK